MVPHEKARIHVLSHALHYGSGVFEGIRAYDTTKGPAIFRLREHVERLFHSAAAFGMKIPYSRKKIENAIRKVVAANQLHACYLRPLVFFGEGTMTLFPRGAKLHVMIAAWPWKLYFGEGTAISIGISRYVRFHKGSVVPGAKIGGYYATSVLATLDARARGFDECVMMDHEGYVAEGPGENIFLIKAGRVFTPNSPSILRGITRESVIEIVRDLGMGVIEKKITLSELMGANEVFLTGTAAEITPVGKINNRRIGKGGMGPITTRIAAIYRAAVHGKLPRYRRWLTAA